MRAQALGKHSTIVFVLCTVKHAPAALGAGFGVVRASQPELFARVLLAQRRVAAFPLGAFLIFGFNTDVKFADTVYHVQSEALQHELLIQTQVFVKGRCIGKHAVSYAKEFSDSSEEHVHELLKEQHKHIVAAAREGRVEAQLDLQHAEPAVPHHPVAAVLAAPPTEAPPLPLIEPEMLTPSPAAQVPAPAAAASAPTAQLTAVPAASPADALFTLKPAGNLIGKGLGVECLPPSPAGDGITIGVRVTEQGDPAADAQVACRITSGKGPATYVYAVTSSEGLADVRVGLSGLDLTATALLVQATHRGKSASRKFNLIHAG